MSQLILVTGGAGFVGSHLCERLTAQGHRVISLDNYFTGSVDNHVPGVTYLEGHTKDIFAHITETPDIVFHLGEYARTEKSFEDIEYVWDLNKTGTFAVLEFCRAKKCKLLYAGSSTKFADQGAGRDQSPYAWSKATNTELVQNYGRWYGLQYAITYFYNVYGPREMSGPFGTLIKIFSELTRLGQPLTIVAPGDQRRNFTHVSDIVNGLVLVGEKGVGDGYGIGADESFSVLEVATMFGGKIFLMPERPGNRLTSGVDNVKTKALGWYPQESLPAWIKHVTAAGPVTASSPVRILMFATTFYPTLGVSESALCEVIKTFPEVQFDIITTAYREGMMGDQCPFSNVSVYPVGVGSTLDKYLLPIVGTGVAKRLLSQHTYVFKWSLLASYGTFAAIFARTNKPVPLLITLADQRLESIPWYLRIIFRFILGRADQVHVTDSRAAKRTLELSKRSSLMRSIGDGDAFANQMRITYSQFLRQLINK